MNNQYAVENGKVFVIDKANNLSKRDYYDKTEEILQTENLIEEIKYELEKIRNNEINIESSPHNLKSLIKISIIFLSGLLIFLEILGSIIALASHTSFLSLQKIVFIPYGVISSVFLISTSVVASIYTYLNKIDKSQTLPVLDYEEENLKKQLEQQLKKLDNLKRNAQIKKDISKDAKDVDKKNLEELKKQLKLYKNLLSNYKQYQKYYNKNILESKLTENYNCDEEEVSLVRNYFKEKNN